MKISEVEFGSLLTYTPRGKLTEHFRSRTVMRNLKNDEVLQSGILMSSTIAQTIRRELRNYPFSDYFNENTILIPIPKSSLPQKDDLWVPQRIASALSNNDLGRNEECLYRNIALPRSSTSLASDRPKAFQHYNSMKIKKLLFDPEEIIKIMEHDIKQYQQKHDHHIGIANHYRTKIEELETKIGKLRQKLQKEIHND